MKVHNLVKSAFYLFLISIPFGTRILLYQFTTGFHEYEAVFLYGSDAFLILFLGCFAFWGRRGSRLGGSDRTAFSLYKISLALFILLVGASIFFAYSKGLAIYNFVRLDLLVLMALAVGKIIKDGIVKLDTIMAVMAGSAVVQALIGFGQFLGQKSLGLWFLGESVLGTDVGGAAKIVVDGAKILRAYGTFPHPNVLAAFLLLGLLSCYYFFLRKYEKHLIAAAIFIIWLGLVLSFSRAAWAIVASTSLFIILYSLFQKEHGRQARFLLFILISTFYFLFSIFSPYIIPRAKIAIDEPAVSYRMAYNNLGWKLLQDRPLGVGIGNQVLYSVKSGLYQKLGMDQVWQWQPIHNFYLLAASEIGVIGLLSLLYFLATILLRTSKNIVIVMLPALLLFGLSDHFLWTLQPGRLMLWLVIGIVMGASSAHSSMDRAYPSEG